MHADRGAFAAAAATGGPTQEVVDFDLHGLLGIRLTGASPEDLAAVYRQLGPLEPCRLNREPDLRVRFVPHLSTGDVRYVEAERTGYTEDGRFLLGDGKGRPRASLSLETIGDACEIVCERGSGPVPLLAEILKIAGLRRGLVSLHASAFEFGGSGILVIGWAHSGKSASLLAFAEKGARLIGDDLVFVSGDGLRMFGLASPVEFADWQVRQVPRLWGKVGAGRRLLSAAHERLRRLHRAAPQGGPRAPGWQLTSTVLRGMERRLRVRLPADALTPGFPPRLAEPRKLFLAMTHEAPEVRVERADPEETIQRVIHLSRVEGLSLLRSTLAFRFAFPAKAGDLIEGVQEIEARLIRSALAGKEMYIVHHPRPVGLDALYAALRPFTDTDAPAASIAGGAAVPSLAQTAP